MDANYKSVRKVSFWRRVMWIAVFLLCLTLAGMYLYYYQGMAEMKGANEVTQYGRGRELFLDVLRWGVAGVLLCVWVMSFSRRMMRRHRRRSVD